MGKRIQQLKKILGLGRPRTGQRYFSVSFSITQKQREYLDQHPNASEHLRKLLDSIIDLHDEFTESKISVLAMKHEIDTLQTQAQESYKNKHEYYMEHKNEIWEEDSVSENGTVYVFDSQGIRIIEEKPATVKPTEDAQYHYKIWKELSEKEAKVQVKINELKDKIIHHPELI